MTTQKRPLTALFLSLFVPGLGQIYNSEQTKGILILIASLAFALAFFLLSGLAAISAMLALFFLWLSALLDGYKTAKLAGQSLDWYYRVPYVIAMLLLVGPLALPLLWRSPYFSRPARWGWTILVVGAVLLTLALPFLANRLIQQLPSAITIPLREFPIPRWHPFPNVI